ncbi:MAG: hypothetical protein ACLRFJ_01115 [Alphaproteobacteria bacterium]
MKVKNIIFSGAMASILMMGGAYAAKIVPVANDGRLATASYVQNGVLAAEDYTDEVVAGLDANVTSSADNGVTVNVTQTDGEVSGVVVTVGADDAATSGSTKLITSGAVYTGLSNKANSADVYAKTETYTQAEVNAKLDEKQDNLSETQLAAVDSGITAEKVGQYDEHIADADIHVTAAQKTAWTGKQDALNTAQLAAVNSGITADKVAAIGTNTTAIEAEVTRATGAEGTLTSLKTEAKNNLVAAINEVDTNADAAKSAADAAQTDVDALEGYVGEVSADNMGTTASTVVGAIKELSGKSVKAGNGVTVANDGTVTAKAGSGINVDGSGIGVKVDNSSIKIGTSGIELGYTLTGDSFPGSAS